MACRDGVYCYPLTVADQHTRYLLACHGLLSTKGLGVRPVFDRLFREYGLPDAIRTDNGVSLAIIPPRPRNSGRRRSE